MPAGSAAGGASAATSRRTFRPVVADRIVVLFDIDLTLVGNTFDAEIIAAALDAATGREGILGTLEWRGRTDRWMANELARREGFEPDVLFERYTAGYTERLREAIARSAPAPLAGTRPLLAALRSVPSVVLGVQTGNLPLNARLKLEHAGLLEFFDPIRGGFGDVHEVRADLVRAGAQACGLGPDDRLVVLGDSIYDMAAARVSDAFAIGVATGHATPAELSAAGADLVVPDLANHKAALAAILG